MLSDESYNRIVFDGIDFHSPAVDYDASVTIYTYGKTLLAPGQRVGYAALHPSFPDKAAVGYRIFVQQLASGWGFPNALLQHAIADLESLSVDIPALQARRDKAADRAAKTQRRREDRAQQRTVTGVERPKQRMAVIGIGQPVERRVCVNDGGEQLGRGDLKIGVSDPALQLQRGKAGLVPGEPLADRHVGAAVLDRLKTANRLAELLADLGVFDGEIAGMLGQADKRRGEQELCTEPSRG